MRTVTCCFWCVQLVWPWSRTSGYYPYPPPLPHISGTLIQNIPLPIEKGKATQATICIHPFLSSGAELSLSGQGAADRSVRDCCLFTSTYKWTQERKCRWGLLESFHRKLRSMLLSLCPLLKQPIGRSTQITPRPFFLSHYFTTLYSTFFHIFMYPLLPWLCTVTLSVWADVVQKLFWCMDGFRWILSGNWDF